MIFNYPTLLTITWFLTSIMALSMAFWIKYMTNRNFYTGKILSFQIHHKNWKLKAQCNEYFSLSHDSEFFYGDSKSWWSSIKKKFFLNFFLIKIFSFTKVFLIVKNYYFLFFNMVKITPKKMQGANLWQTICKNIGRRVNLQKIFTILLLSIPILVV